MKAFLIGFVVCACREKRRSEARRSRYEEAGAQRHTALQEGLERERQKQFEVMEALRSLPEDIRIPLWLNMIEGMRSSDVALALETSERTVRDQITRGIEEIRRMLAGAGVTVSAAAVPGLLGALPLETAPATLVAAIGSTAKAGTLGAAAAGGKAAVGVKAATGVAGTAFKIAAVTALSVASVTGAVILKNRAEVQETQGAAKPSEEERAPAAPEAGPVPPAGDPKAPLGAETFWPSAERPIGYRGDGSGKYPGATPPLTWSRLIKSPLQEIKTQSGKPGPDSEKSLAGIGVQGLLKEWMILGPYKPKDVSKAIEEEVTKDEGSLSPEQASLPEGKTWRPAGCMANSVEGTPISLFSSPGDEVAFAHTYVYSPADQSVHLGVSHPFGGIKAWLNGKIVYTYVPEAKIKDNGGAELALVKGWNRILLKSTKVKGVHVAWKEDTRDWQFGGRLSSRETSPNTYETKNILWMSKAPHMPDRCANASSPVLAGNCIFYTAEPSDLICMSLTDGKILWIRSNNPYEIMNDAERKALASDVKEKLDSLASKLKDQNDQIIRESNAVDRAGYLTGANDAKRTALEKLAAEKLKTEENLYNLLQTIDKKYRRNHQTWGHCNQTPATDGKRVFAQFATGAVVCYGLDGAPAWRTFIPGTDSEHHGVHASPVLMGNRLLINYGSADYWANIMGIDTETGKEAWHFGGQQRVTSKEMGMQPCKVNGEDAVITTFAYGFRASDGKQLFGQPKPALGGGRGFGAPVVENGQFVKFDEACWYIYNLPGAGGGAAQQLFQVKHGAEGSPGSGPVFLNGLLYGIGYFGKLSVLDAAAGKIVYERQLNVDARDGSRTYSGCSSNPALAGKNLYFPDNSGTMIVIEPGREYHELARNVIDNFYNYYNNREREQFPTTFTYTGKHIIMRGSEFIYCVGEK